MSHLMKMMELQRKYKDSLEEALTNVVGVKGDGSTFKDLGSICFRNVSSNSGFSWLVSYIRPSFKENITQDTYNTTFLFLDYVVNRSPYKDVFFSKDPLDIYNNGALINVHLPNSFVFGGMTAMRTAWEYPQIPKHWQALVRLGVGENLAFLGAHNVFQYKEEEFYEFLRNTSNHIAVCPDTKEYLENFLKGNLPNKKDPLLSTGKYPIYGSISSCWRSRGNPYNFKFLTYKPKGKKVIKPVWGGEKVMRGDTSLEGYAKYLIERFQDKPKEVKAKNPRKTHVVFMGLTEENGFSPAEIKRIKNQIRRILGPVQVDNGGRYGYPLSSSFTWVETPQGHGYWEEINARVQEFQHEAL